MIASIPSVLVAKGVPPADAEKIVALNNSGQWPEASEAIDRLITRFSDSRPDKLDALTSQIAILREQLTAVRNDLSDRTYDLAQALKGA